LKLTQNITENENSYLKMPKIFFNISKKLKFYLLKEDLFKFKEQLLISASLEHLKQLKITPTDLEVHSSLANIYTSLSKLYFDAKETIFFSKTSKTVLNQKYEICIKTTIEEFKILNDYAPNDPWIHLQLANSYNKLGLKKEEIKEYEVMYKLCPNDNNILFKLGCLYFETKKNAKGLRIYEELQMRSFAESDKLLSYYGVFKTEEILSETI
ncbi:MAG: hypothetical protein KR126chlam6_00741, partial [Candidatus Anoxychlamydiales bacterium]|nr:hypothetical protein [Candidatus Anoxychlamydiales bacterium]